MSEQPPIEDRVQALEERRAADRILAAVVADLDPSDDEWDRQTVGEIQASQGHLNEAHQAVLRAATLLGGTESERWPELKHWGPIFSPFPDIADRLARIAEGGNFGEAQRIHQHVRGMFDTVRSSDSALADKVDPLADWTALDVDEEHNPWKLYPAQMVVGIIAVLFALWRWLSPYFE